MSDDRGEHRGGSLGFPQAILAIVGALVLVGLNVVQFVYRLNPALRPDPNEQLSATVKVIEVERQVTIGEYLRRVSAPSRLEPTIETLIEDTLDSTNPSHKEIERARPRVLKRLGVAVYAKLTVEGLKRRRVLLHSTLYDARTRRRIPAYDEKPLSARKLTSPTDRFVEILFIDRPPRAKGKYFIRLELRVAEERDERQRERLGTLLAVTNSREFASFPEK